MLSNCTAVDFRGMTDVRSYQTQNYKEILSTFWRDCHDARLLKLCWGSKQVANGGDSPNWGTLFELTKQKSGPFRVHDLLITVVVAVTGTMMGYSVQPYFTNMTNSSMGREFADCNNINMSFLPAHQVRCFPAEGNMVGNVTCEFLLFEQIGTRERWDSSSLS